MKPGFRVLANDNDISTRIGGRLVSLRLTDESGTKSDTVEIELSDHDPAQPVQIPPTGAELQVYLGYEPNLKRMGTFVVDEVELAGWPSTLTIRGRAAVYDKTPAGKKDLQTMMDRSWPAGTKLGDVVKKIASDHGMKPACAASLASIVLPHTDQTDESDLNFLIRVGRKYDAIVKVAGGTISVAKRGESIAAGSGKPLARVSLSAIDCTSYRVSLTKRESAGTVVAYYQDKAKATRTAVTAGSGKPEVRLKHDYPTKDQAERAAQSQLARRQRGERSLSLTMPGNPDLTADCRLTTSGFRDGVNGEWLVTSVVHDFSPSSGYSCTVDAESPS